MNSGKELELTLSFSNITNKKLLLKIPPSSLFPAPPTPGEEQDSSTPVSGLEFVLVFLWFPVRMFKET